MKRLATVLGWCLACAASAALAQTATQPAPATPAPALRIPYPEWLFPVSDEALLAQRKPPKEAPKLDDVELLGIPGSDQRYTLARINDPFNADRKSVV